jgi:hypothetical protein
MLTLDFDLPSTRSCNLKCKYCFIETDERQLQNRQHSTCKRINIKQLRRVFAEARKLGCRSAKLVGDQEPLLEHFFVPFVEYVSNELKMWLVIFTNGTVLYNDSLCKQIHGMDSQTLIDKLYEMRVSIMLKFHSFSNEIEDELVGVKGYAAKRNFVLERLIEKKFNAPPMFSSDEEQKVMTGTSKGKIPEMWTRLGLESVITPQCFAEAESIYRLKKDKHIFIDLDPPVPIGLTQTEATRKKCGIHTPPSEILELICQIYSLNHKFGIPFKGPSPYIGGFPCSQLPYGLYVNAMGRIYPCCGCPDIDSDGRSDYLGNIHCSDALLKAIENNPYRKYYKKYGYAYDSAPFNQKNYIGYGLYHGCPYRDRAGDLMPKNWEVAVNEFLENKILCQRKDMFYEK